MTTTGTPTPAQTTPAQTTPAQTTPAQTTPAQTTLQRLQRRDTALRAVRAFFHARGFVEADTPQLVPGPGLEPHIDPLAVDVRTDLLATTTARRFLITSPELALKRVVAAGVPRVFQLVHVFRDGERTARHSPEFTMLEWYRGPGTLEDILDDTVGVVRAVAAALQRSGVALATGALDVAAPPARMTCREAFARAGVDLAAAIDETRAGDADALPRRVRATGELLPGTPGFDDAFFHVMGTRVEPAIGHDRLAVVEGWPASMAVLARVDDDDPRFARRFEIYAQGRGGCLELCNAFDELTDAVEQRARFAEDIRARVELGKAPLPLDEDFLAALPAMPSPSAGNALGVDRLLMLLTGASTIDDVTALPWR